MNRTIRKATSFAGSPDLPADKSISHRAAILGSLAEGRTDISGYSTALDPCSTLSVLRSLGVEMSIDGPSVTIEGKGLSGISVPGGPLDCGNSGTTMRLLAGVLAGSSFPSALIGDASLGKRPMERIARPLREMGADISLTDGHAPVRIMPVDTLHGTTYSLPVASAQVKSCVLLAGLYADGPTTVVESAISRDHTERMMGLDTQFDGRERRMTVHPGHLLSTGKITIPADFSAAAFFLVAGATIPDSHIRLDAVGINPTRAALLDVLKEMGASISVYNQRTQGREPVADIEIRYSPLSGISVNPSLVPNLIDEFPALLVAATQAEGVTHVCGASELRHKETDRISAMSKNLAALGADVVEAEDGITIRGRRTLVGTTVSSYDDHRIAMAMGVAGLLADGTTTVLDADSAAVSFPDYWQELDKVSGRR